jgi:hypothetical protein
MRSLQGRLTTGLVTILIAVFLIQWLLVSLAINRVTENYVIDRLHHEIENLVVALSFNENGVPTIDAARVGPVYHRAFSGHYFRIATDAGDVIRSRSLWDHALKVPELKPGASLRLHSRGPEHQPLLILVQGFQKQGVDFSVSSSH